MFYTIYKTTNLINGKFYIGKHQTEALNDGYIGSGKLLKRAIKKYGIENFHNEILFMCKSEKHMNILEKIFVVPDQELNYNLCPGGHGGWGYLNDSSDSHIERCKIGYKNANLSKYNYSRDTTKSAERFKYLHSIGYLKHDGFLGKNHSEETKKKIGERNKISQKGSKNSQYGTSWINNGKTNKKVRKEELDLYLSQGYTKGRLVNR